MYGISIDCINSNKIIVRTQKGNITIECKDNPQENSKYNQDVIIEYPVHYIFLTEEVGKVILGTK